MTHEQWLQIKEIFRVAVDLAPESRCDYLKERCNGDEELLRELQSLLEADDETADFIEQPALISTSELLSAEDQNFWQGQTIGRYRIVRELGRGGMGVVYLAERDDEQFRKLVALKLIKRGMDTDAVIERFRNERQILAELEHPNIARLLDGGATADGLPYLVMEYVEGVPLMDYCDERRLTTSERLRLFRSVCAAVSYAHQHLVVHRDLKPSNILITEDGTPKLLDFGIAKVLDSERQDPTREQTRADLRALTPEYASPEQVRGRHITTASDIYSLGVILYQLLTGHRPYRLKSYRPEEIVRAICEEEPARPSTVINRSEEATSGEGQTETKLTPAAVSAMREGQPDKLRRRLRGDLDNIVLKAMHKEPEHRYASAQELSEDIERHLAGLPVRASRPLFSYRASKFIARHKVGVAATAFVLIAMVVGVVGIIWQSRIARAERDRANIERAKAERISGFLSNALSYSDPAAAAPGAKNRRDATISQMLDDFAPRIETELSDEPEVRASLQRTVGSAYISQNRLAEAEQYLNAALETQLKIYGERNQEVALTLSSLGAAEYLKGDFPHGEESIRKAIAIYHEQPPHEQKHLKAFANALVALGGIDWTKGDYQSADAHYSESLSVASQLQGTDREALADAQLGLGTTRYAQGRLDEAKALIRESLNEYHRLPQTRWKWGNALNSLAQVLTWNKEYDEALDALHESEQIELEIWGEDNQLYARSLWLSVYAFCFKGDCAAAEEPLNQAEEIYKRISPDNKAIMANVYDARDLFLTRTGRASEGEAFGRKAVEFYQSTMNRGAASITLARINLAESLEAQKKFDEAERVLLEAYKDASEVQGAQHWRTKTAAHALAEFYDAHGKPDEATRYRALT